MKRILGIIYLLILLCLGCQSTRLVKEGEATRNAILDLYTEQAMDNLVRARCNLPFIQLAYRNLGVQDLDTLSGSANDTYGDSRAVTRNAAGIITSALHTVSNSLVLGGSASRSKTLSYTADPITDKNDIYVYYLAFANDPGLLIESRTKPKCGYHILRHFKDKWYWVPEEAGPVFLALVLKTSMMRGPELLPPPNYERKIAKVYLVNTKHAEREVSIIEFDQSIPFGDGYMDFTLGKNRYHQEINYFEKPETSEDGKIVFPAIEEGRPSKYVKLTILKKMPYRASDLVGLPVQIFSNKFPPEVPRPSPELQRLQDSVDSINVNLKNLLTTPR
jgi:hypothetical protein